MPHPFNFDRLSPDDLDQLVRVVYGEAGNEPDEGQQAVAAVIGNRLNSRRYGRTVGEVISAPGQFEAMSHPDKLAGLDPRSLEYQRIKMNILGMQDDPTGGATLFYSPRAQSALGRDAPTWAKGRSGLDIGNHRFLGGTKINDAYGNVPNTPSFAPVLQGTTVIQTPLNIPLPPPRPADPGVTGTVPAPAPVGVPGAAPTGNPSLDAALSKVSPALRENFMRALAAAPPDIRTAISINSGLRTIDRQRELFEKKLQETGGDYAAARRMVAPPGHSQHERGNALDLGYATPAAKTWMHQNAAQYGLNFPMSYEDWHIEPVGVRGPAKVLPPEAGGAPAGSPPVTPRVTELEKVSPGATSVPQMAPGSTTVIKTGPSLGEQIASMFGGGSGLSGAGGGSTGGGGMSVSSGIEDAGYDERLGQLGQQALNAPLPFNNLQGIGSVLKTKFDFAPPDQIGTPQGAKQSALLKKLMAGL